MSKTPRILSKKVNKNKMTNKYFLILSYDQKVIELNLFPIKKFNNNFFIFEIKNWK